MQIKITFLVFLLLLSSCQAIAQNQPTLAPTSNILATPTIPVTPFGITGRALMGAIARTCPNTSCPRATAYQDESFVLVNAVNGSLTEGSDIWYEVHRGSEIFYIHSGSVNIPLAVPPTQPPAANSSSNQSVSCPSTNFTCSQLTCPQAYACLRAGNGSLDNDGDGVPCESVCQ